MEEERQASKKLEQEVEITRLQNEMEAESLKQEEWKHALTKLEEARELKNQDHKKCMEDMDQMAVSSLGDEPSITMAWLKAQMAYTQA